MSDQSENKIHWSFWVISVIALLWNVMGVINFIAQMNPEVLEMYRESERAIIEGRPIWATAGFAIAVIAGALGGLLLLLRRRLAPTLFLLSFFGTIVAVLHSVGSGISFGAGEIVGIIAMPIIVAAFLIWYSQYAGRRSWLK